MTDIDQIKATLARIEAKVDAISAKPKAHLTRVEFAKLAGLHPNTVARRINAGLIRTERGRIPFSELESFVS